MSEGFDKEAEREKLRKKFAKDDEKREHTKRMSELLLKGATMTNRHCETCGDPIFRHDDREFCPSCSATTNGADGGQAATGVEDPAAVDPQNDPVDGPTGSTDANDAHGVPDAGDGGPVETASRDVHPRAGAERSAAPAARPGGPVESDRDEVAADIAAARASLARTLSRFAQEAEQTDDPRRARDHLQAAREAAEALRALE